jgi:uncharacterized protein
LCGLALPNDRTFLQLCRGLIEEQAELFEVTPELSWRAGAEPGAGHASMLQLVRGQGRPVVGHGVLYGLGNAEPPARRAAWERGLERDAASFACHWLSDHLGFADAGSLHATLPLPLPPTPDAVAAVVKNLRALQAAHPIVAFENNADLFCVGDPLAQPLFFAAICEDADAWLLLDLHNAFTFCQNLGVDFDRFLDRLPWERVLEIHLSGGSESDPEWLPSRRTLRLDSHDGAVPEPVWRAFAAALPRAKNLRAVVLEWLPDGMQERHAAQLTADFARARRQLC